MTNKIIALTITSLILLSIAGPGVANLSFNQEKVETEIGEQVAIDARSTHATETAGMFIFGSGLIGFASLTRRLRQNN